MSNLQEEIFEGNTTLWNVLNAQGVPDLAEQTRQLKQQLDSLALTVQNYQFQTNADIARLNSEITTINIKLTDVMTDVSNLKTATATIETQIVSLTTQLSGISADIVSLTERVMSLEVTTELTVLRVDNLFDYTQILNTRITDLETNQNTTFIRYNTRYSVIEWPFWGTGWENYEMIITGTGGYVPINRSVVAVINSISRNVVFGIANRDTPPNTNGAPAPLMEGLASANWGQGASLIYINKTQ